MTEVQEKKGLGVRPSQLVAGALAAVTAAVLGSFFGVEGTVIGAGLASVISTMVSAVYQASLERAKKAAKQVALNTGALRGQSGTAVQQPAQRQPTQRQPAQQVQPPRPPQPAMRPGQPNPTRASHSSVYRPVDSTSQIASLATPLSEQRTQMMRPAQPGQAGSTEAAPTEYMGPVNQTGQPETTERPWWLRRWKMLLGLTVAVFAIGIAVASGVELINGGTLSGDKGAPSIARVFSGDTSKKVDKQTPSDKKDTGSDTGSTATSTESTTTEDTATETTTPTTDNQQDGGGQQQRNAHNTDAPTPQNMPVPPTGATQPAK